MTLKIHKPGQGYWTRVLTAIGAGMFIVAGGFWLSEMLKWMEGAWAIGVRAGAIVLVVAVFGWFVFKAVGTSPRMGDFLIATEGEMKKVNWPPRREVIGSTQVVVWTVVLLTALLFASDNAFSFVLQKIGVIEGI